MLFLLGSCQKKTIGNPDATPQIDTSETIYSCRYNNVHAGPDCREYIGSKWDDPVVREEDCGAAFYEADAEVVPLPCPDHVEVDGEKKPMRSVCHAHRGTPEEFDLYSYEGDLDILQSACENYLDGEFEIFVDGGVSDRLHEPLPEALDALDSTDQVMVSSDCKEEDCLLKMIENKETFDFSPVDKAPNEGLVLYPGGNVDPRAYAPSAVALAAQGLFVAIVPMEDYLAFTGYDRADDVRAAHPEIRTWFVGGHSLGGAMAARYGTTQSGQTMEGIIIWASVAGNEYDISEAHLRVLSIYATMDEGNTPEQVKEYAHTLPSDATYICIVGGDHSQFAYYEDSRPPAAISREEQQRQIVDATVRFIRNDKSLVSVDCTAE